MKLALCTTLALLMPLAASAALPGDAAAGKRLYDASCTSCHDASVFTRQNRRVQSLDALRGQVQACGHMAKQDFTPQQLQDLVKYLNDRFYRFP
jgi:mono/diheme cytochrome c family protein